MWTPGSSDTLDSHNNPKQWAVWNFEVRPPTLHRAKWCPQLKGYIPLLHYYETTTPVNGMFTALGQTYMCINTCSR